MKNLFIKSVIAFNAILYSSLLLLVGFTLGVRSSIEPKPISGHGIAFKYKISDEKSTGLLDSTVGLRSSSGSCSGTVIDRHFIVTAAHCISADGGTKLRQETITVVDKDGNEITTATPAAFNPRVDYGILIGDFEQFQYMKIEVHKDVFFRPLEENHHFIACGYPFHQKEMVCTPFIPEKTYEFTISGQGIGIFYPGMSGGPVIDVSTNTVVGVIFGVFKDMSLITSTVGLFEAFNIEP